MSDAPLHRRYAPSPALDNSPGEGGARCPADWSVPAENGHKEEAYDDEDLEDDVEYSSRLARFMRDRQRAKSLPAFLPVEPYEDNSLGRKRVKFADSMGLDLAIVKHFSSQEEPQIPSKVLSRFRSFPPRQQERAGGPAIGDLCDSFTSSLSTAATPKQQQQQVRLVACFPNPAEEDLDRRLRRGRVALEKIAITQFGVRGHIRVLLAAADEEQQVREVGVRYTFNDWLSHVDAQALPVPAEHQQSPDRYQLFSFTMYTPPFVEPGSVHFALYLRTEQGDFWDNNDGENYTLGIHYTPGATASFVSAAFQPT